jgi:hypothetical protein
MRTVSVAIKGVSPILMHAFPMVPIEALEKKSPQEQAEIAAYRDPETRGLYVPAVALQRCFVNGATYSKGKGRASLQKNVAACVLIGPEERLALGQETFTVDARPIVVPATKGRVMRYRPRLDSWELAFTIDFDENLLTEAQMRRIVDDSGSRVGLLDFRPEKKGPFGRFMVTNWQS